MTATPEKLRVYEETFRAETHQSAVVPGQTWVAVADGDGSPPRVHHLRGPFPPEGAFQRFGSICYCSDQMADIVRAVRPVVENASELLLVTGETGTGKDALANSIHIESRRPGTPVIENASALGTDMAQDQLVGHSKGTFTGADADRDGWLTEAAGGTLIIQEIGDMPLEHQIKLLTILGERKYRRLGDHRKYELTAQLTMTTSLDVDALVAAGLFRPELLFRFQRRVHIPPLRERLEDIRAIVQGWHVDRPDFYPQLPEPALALLCSYDWPGNVRSLENVFVRLRDGGDWTLEQIREEVEREHRRHTATPRPGGGPALEPAEQGLLELLALGRAMPRREIERLLPAANKATTVKRLNRLIRKGLVRKVGNGPTACYQRVA